MDGEGLDPQAKPFRVHLLDVGLEKYGDCLLLQFGDTRVLIDGAHTGDHDGSEGHDSIPDQIGALLGSQPPYTVDLLVVSHAHEDHIGCLPRLVSDGVLHARWALVSDPGLGWGRAVDAAPPDAGADERVRRVLAGLRELPRVEELDGRRLEAFLADAVSLESQYTKMLENLEQADTRVVRYVSPDEQDLQDLIDDLQNRNVTLSVLGPSQAQLLTCADRLAEGMEDAVDAAQALLETDANLDARQLYVRLATGESDAVDGSRLGNLVNLQSLVTQFEFRGRKLLFAGDMQFARPGVNEAKISEGIAQLKQDIAAQAPYDFVKISHHGAENAFDEDFLEGLGGTKLFGICAGEKSTKHPHREVLALLDSQQPAVRWARTDRNRRTTVKFFKTLVRVEPEVEPLNDARPNSADEASPAASAPSPELGRPAAGTGTTPGGLGASERFVEVVAKIPNERTRVTLTVEVEPAPDGGRPLSRKSTTAETFQVAGGRTLPKLLVVTSRDRLAENIGEAEARSALNALRARGFSIIEDLPSGAPVLEAAAIVGLRLRSEPAIEGVLLLGGYDVVPSLRLDVLSPALRQRIGSNDDPDDFVVWSDELYASLDGDTVADLPISRIPDGRSAALLRGALEARNRTAGTGRCGVRNVNREFADRVFRLLPGDSPLHRSAPAAYDQEPPLLLDRDLVYLMLHGDDSDSTRFWGEGTEDGREAINLRNLPSESGPLIFTGACWGALTVDPPAVRAEPLQPLSPKTPESSLALSFLSRGATAFVGCTGAHYSPIESPFDYYGAPMHEAFWKAHLTGASPAAAVLEAKRQYAAQMPHGRTSDLSQAIERKILRQFTCLGLGF
jgi:beta-lactamase superfamily II metal-dependent hydrolase